MIAGVSLIQRVYERAAQSKRANAVFVATDDDRIADHVSSFSGRFVKPVGDFQSGTDRIAAALDLLAETYDQVVNVQGDEPMIDVDSIDSVIEVLQTTSVDMATLATPIDNDGDLQARDIVKVVTSLAGDALYFSRAPMAGAQRHVGMYGYQTRVIRALASRAPSPLELAESLEQLRALQNGFKIRVVQTKRPHLGVDRPEDVARVEHELAKQV